MSTVVEPRPLFGLLMRLVAVALLATMGALFKLANTRGVHFVEVLFWRQAASVPIIFFWSLLTAGGLRKLATPHRKMHALRALYGTAGMILGLGTVALLPLAEATTFSFTVPIFAVLISSLIYKEPVGKWRWSAVAAGFAGILIITQPGNSHIPLFGAMVGLAGGFMIALTMFQIADLGRLDKPYVIVFWFASVSSTLFFLAVPFVHRPYDVGTLVLLVVMGTLGCIGQVLLTFAFRFGSVASIIIMDYSALFWATLYGYLLFDLLPPAATWLGAPLIVGAGLLIAWREHRLALDRAAESTPLKGT